MIQDLRYFLRVLAKSPGYAVWVVLTLALGIGATCAAFAVLRAVLLRPLPYPEPERLAIVGEERVDGYEMKARAPHFAAWRDHQQVFESVMFYDPLNYMTLEGAGEPQRIVAHRTSAFFLEVLGTKPLLGRGFTPDDDRPGAPAVVLLSHGLWTRHLGADPGVVGRDLLLSGREHTVVGVLGADFVPPTLDADAWVPAALGDEAWNDWITSVYVVIGRLKPGVTLEQAQAQLFQISEGVVAEWPREAGEWYARVHPLHEHLVGDMRWPLTFLFASSGLVLLVACANVSHLVLARHAVRQREMALRLALGAGRRRLLRQVLTESAFLTLLGGAGGLTLAWAATRAAAAWNPGSVPRLETLAVDYQVVGFAFATVALVSFLFSLVPIAAERGRNLVQALQEGVRGGAGKSGRFHDLVIVVESALVLMLLVGAVQMGRSLLRLSDVDVGFEAAGRLTFTLTLSETKYAGVTQMAQAFGRVLAEIEALPGVEAAGTATNVPLASNWWSYCYAEGAPLPTADDHPECDYEAVSHDYLRALGVERVRGRSLLPGDVLEAAHVAVINETMARRYPSDPLGRKITINDPDGPSYNVVGIVKDLRVDELSKASQAAIFVSDQQVYYVWQERHVVVQTRDDPLGQSAAIRRAVAAADPEAAISNLRTMEEVVYAAAGKPRFQARLMAAFAAVALALGGIGVYGIVAYGLARRRREMGIRLAFGARSWQILRLGVGSGLKPLLAGMVIGTFGTFATSRVLAGLLYEVRPTEPWVIVGVGAFLTAVGVLATFFPALDASRVDPVESLRYDG